jgi:hypothetical protein
LEAAQGNLWDVSAGKCSRAMARAILALEGGLIRDKMAASAAFLYIETADRRMIPT